MAETWFFHQDRARGVVRDENGLLVCQDVSESDGDLIASAPRLAEENEKLRAQVATLREALIEGRSAYMAMSEAAHWPIDSHTVEQIGAALEATKEGV